VRGGHNNVPERVAYALFETNWKIRRRVMFASLIYIAFNISWILTTGDDTAVNQQAIIAFIAAGVSIIGAYVFGAVWDDNNKRERLVDMDLDVSVGTGRRERDEAPPVEGGLL